jgi:hypothetical protein
MSKQRRAQALTVVVLAAAGFLAVGRKLDWRGSTPGIRDLLPAAAQPKPDPTPQDAIYAMLDAARDGNIPKYLESYTGQMRASLDRAVAETTESGFRKYLRESNAPIKGIAITEPQQLTDREVKVRVEYVFQDRNEAQFMYLEKSGKDWRIARVDAAERVKTLVPYGTPVQ